MSVTLLKRLNLGLYSVAAFLIVMLFLPIGQWFDIVNVNFKLTFFIISFFGLASLPTAIYTKNIRKILSDGNFASAADFCDNFCLR